MSIWSDLQDRSTGEIIRKEDYCEYSFNPDDLSPTSNSTLKIILDIARADFEFGGFSSLEEMLSTLEVTLVISSATPTRIVPSGISEWVLYWKNELKRLESILGKDCESNQLYKDAKEELEKAQKESEAWATMAYLGRYDRFQKEIILYPNNMPGQDREKYLATTFVHEAMHAYFDRHPRELFPYVATVEEPLAEFGMLLFLKETNNTYYEWAYRNVVSKETCYRYGAALMDRYEKGDEQIRQDLESYKRKVF